MRHRLALLGAAVLLGSVSAFAADEPDLRTVVDPGLRLLSDRQLLPLLDVERAVAAALAHPGALAVPAENARAAHARAQGTALLAAPTLKLSADRDQAQNSAPAPAVRSKFELAWTPPQWGERNLKRQQLNGLAQASEVDVDLARERVALRVRELHATLVALQELLPLSAQAVDLHAQLRDTAEQQVRAGRRTRQELLDVLQQAILAEDALEDVRLEQDRARRQLQALLGPLSLRELRIPSRVGPLVADEPPGETVDAPDPVRHLSLQAADAHCAALDADLRLKALDNDRWLKSVAATYAPRQGERAANVGVQLEVLLPMAGYRNGDETSLNAQRAACLADRDQLVQASALQREEARAELARAHRAARLQLRQLAAAQDSQSLVLAARSAGRADHAEVLAAGLAVNQKRQAALRQLLQIELGALAWRQASGQSLVPAPSAPALP